MKRDCDCKEWKETIPVINGLIIDANAHSISYKGKPFDYCPWCGKKLV